MKLIDLLVQELPKCGGWPNGAERCRVGDFNGDSITIAFCFPKGYSDGFDVPFQYTVTIPIPGRYVSVATDYCMITRDLYESALAALQKQTWNGEGLPPVGCECELKYKCHDDDAYWERVVILWQRGDDTLVEYVGDHFKHTTQLIHKTSMNVDFRPLRTEADKKHDEVINEIASMIGRGTFYEDAERIYEAIAAGKIPGVKLED